MEKHTKDEILKLCYEQIGIDEAREHQTIIVGNEVAMRNLIKVVGESDYGHVPANWAVQLYMRRN